MTFAQAPGRPSIVIKSSLDDADAKQTLAKQSFVPGDKMSDEEARAFQAKAIRDGLCDNFAPYSPMRRPTSAYPCAKPAPAASKQGPTPRSTAPAQPLPSKATQLTAEANTEAQFLSSQKKAGRRTTEATGRKNDDTGFEGEAEELHPKRARGFFGALFGKRRNAKK